MFHGKCAYCETALGSGQFSQVEHYRPKRQPRTAPNLPVPDHPGYYWLAYAWENLFPACQRCNNSKGTQFPVDGQHAYHPDDLEGEQPLLLNPRLDRPHEHLAFRSKTGALQGLTPRGQTTIELCNLNRAELCDERRETFHVVRVLWYQALHQITERNEDDARRQLERIESIVDGRAEYALVGRYALRESVVGNSQIVHFLSLIQRMMASDVRH